MKHSNSKSDLAKQNFAYRLLRDLIEYDEFTIRSWSDVRHRKLQCLYGEELIYTEYDMDTHFVPIIVKVNDDVFIAGSKYYERIPLLTLMHRFKYLNSVKLQKLLDVFNIKTH